MPGIGAGIGIHFKTAGGISLPPLPASTIAHIDVGIDATIIDGDVDNILDQTGNGNTLFAPAGLQRPIWREAGIDGQDAMQFDRSVPHRMRMDVDIVTPFTAVLVMKPTQIAINSSVFWTGISNNRPRLRKPTNGARELRLDGADAVNGTWVQDRWSMVYISSDTDNTLDFRAGGSELNTTAFGTLLLKSFFHIGAQDNLLNPGNLWLAQFILCDTFLIPQERTDIETRLSIQYPSITI